MQGILIFGLAMAAVAGVFWIMEAWPFVKHVKSIKLVKTGDRLKDTLATTKYNIDIMMSIPLLLPLAIDLAITMALTSIFSFGGTTGGIIGLFISNILSAFILIVSKVTIK